MEISSALGQKFYSIVSKCLIKKADQRLTQVEFESQRSVDSEAFLSNPYGYFARPKGGEEAIAISPGRKQGSVIVGVDGPETSLDLGSGDVGVTNSSGVLVHLDGETLRMKAKTIELDGDLKLKNKAKILVEALEKFVEAVRDMQIITPQGPGKPSPEAITGLQGILQTLAKLKD